MIGIFFKDISEEDNGNTSRSQPCVRLKHKKENPSPSDSQQ